MKEADYRDLMDLILHGKMRAGEQWSAALQTQLCYELKTFLLAGHETSAAMLTYSLLELVHDAELRRRVVEEADAVLGKDGSRVRPRGCVCRVRGASTLLVLTCAAAVTGRSTRGLSPRGHSVDAAGSGADPEQTRADLSLHLRDSARLTEWRCLTLSVSAGADA